MRPWTSLALLVAVCLGFVILPIASAQVNAHIYMSVAPGGPETEVIRSGTAVAYVVLEYQNASQTNLRVEITGNGNIKLFTFQKVYSGSGRENIAVTGTDIFDGYRTAASDQVQTLVQAIDQALASSSASTMRFRTSVAVATAITLDLVLETLERYDVSLDVSDRLEEARGWVQQARAAGESIMNISQVPDDELVSRLTEMRDLAQKAQTATQAALDGMVTTIERPILDGSYTTGLYQSGYLSQSIEWEVRADGMPGTPVAATPTPSPTATRTATPLASPSPTPTAIQPGPTATRPQRTATVRASATPTPILLPPTATPQATVGTTPIPLPPTSAASATVPPGTPVIPIEPVASPTPAMQPTVLATQSQPRIIGTPVTAAPVQTVPNQPAASRREATEEAVPVPAVPEFAPRGEPLPPQETKAFPVQRVGALIGAVLLGLIALWLRTRL